VIFSFLSCRRYFFSTILGKNFKKNLSTKKKNQKVFYKNACLFIILDLSCKENCVNIYPARKKMEKIMKSNPTLKNIYLPAASYFLPLQNGSLEKNEAFALSRRASYLALAPLSFACSGIDVAIGVINGLKTIFTSGKKAEYYESTLAHLDSSRYILVLPYQNLLKCINPTAKFLYDHREKQNLPFIIEASTTCANLCIFLIGLPLLALKSRLENVEKKYKTSNSYFKCSILLRTSYVFKALIATILAATLLIFGSFTILFSFFTLGKYPSLNEFASKVLASLNLITHLFNNAILCINPWPSLPEKTHKIFLK
jgi:hypothetical protein